MTGPAIVYQQELARSEALLSDLNRRFARLGLVRLVVFLGIIGLAAVAVANRGGAAVPLNGVLVVGFVSLIVWHERVAGRRERAARSVAYYQRGLARLEDRWLDGGDPGDRFRDDAHLYATDLEVFGPGSLFHYISVARSETGASKLASWLLQPADPATIIARHDAVRELAKDLSLRHDLAVAAAEARGALDSTALRTWLAGPPAGYPSWVQAATAALAVANVATTAAALAGWIPGFVVLGSYLVSLAVARVQSARTDPVLQSVERPARELRVLAALLSRVTDHQFTSGRLRHLAATWSGAGSAVAEIRRLERLVDLLDARRNQLFMPVAALTLFGTQLGVAIERWRTRVGTQAVGWLEAIGELEALSSFATLAFEHPTDAFPEIVADGALVEATGVAHPLLPSARAVRNDFDLGGARRLVMVSGSNMSGKSTFLKAIGTNVVLALAGAPTRATRFRVGPVTLGASLVLRESLLEGRSRFYAEVLRLKAIVTQAEAGVPVLFLLDEMLSGTNSHDRAIGARGILEGLVARGAIGIVTTHDLALTEIAKSMDGAALNCHLEDELIDGQLHFDYRLKPGVVQRSNALELMKSIGLTSALGPRPSAERRVPSAEGADEDVGKNASTGGVVGSEADAET